MKTYLFTQPNKRLFEKANQADVSSMHMTKNCSNVSLTIAEFAKSIEAGYSFYGGLHSLEEQSAETKQTIKTSTWVEQSVFACDVDHGNFTIEEVLTVSPIQPAVIYKTHSYKEENKRYRVVYFAKEAVTSREDAELLSTYFIYAFAKNVYQDMKVDWSCKDAARILYGGKEVALTNIVEFDAAALIQEIKASGLDKVIEQIHQASLECNKRIRKEENGEVYVPKEKQAKVKKTVAAVVDKETPSVLIGTIEEELHKVGQSLSSRELDSTTAFDFINSLNWNEFFGFDIDEMVCCLLPSHDDSTPSAHFIEVNNTVLYKCFSCGDALNLVQFINVLQNSIEKTSIYQTLEWICEAMDAMLGSEYQRNAIRQLDFNQRYLERLYKNGDKVAKALSRRNLWMLYEQLTNIAKSNVSYAPITANEEGGCATFFVSNRYIQQFMKAKRLSGASDLKTLNRKVNQLVKLGLLEKVDLNDLTPNMQKSVAKYRKTYSFDTYNNSTGEISTITKDMKHISLYRVPYLNQAIISRAAEILVFESENGVKSGGMGVKQMIFVQGESDAYKVYNQSASITISRKDKAFIAQVEKVALSLIEEKGYFTDEELLKSVDKKGQTFTKAQKKALLEKFPVTLSVKSIELTRARVNKELRDKFNIPAKLASRSLIYIVSNA